MKLRILAMVLAGFIAQTAVFASYVLSDNPTGEAESITTGATYSWLTGTNVDSTFATSDSECTKMKDATLTNARGSADVWGAYNDSSQTTAIQLWDLGDIYTIDTVSILYANYNGYGGLGTITVSTSTDGVEYTEWVSISDFEQELLPDIWNTWSWNMKYAIADVSSDTVDAQYVKILTSRSGSSAGYKQQILVETTIYGVPEPMTLGCLLFGLPMLAGMRKRR